MSGGTLREQLAEAMWRSLFSPDEDAEQIEALKSVWTEERKGCASKADAALKVFADWLESEADNRQRWNATSRESIGKLASQLRKETTHD